MKFYPVRFILFQPIRITLKVDAIIYDIAFSSQIPVICIFDHHPLECPYPSHLFIKNVAETAFSGVLWPVTKPASSTYLHSLDAVV